MIFKNLLNIKKNKPKFSSFRYYNINSYINFYNILPLNYSLQLIYSSNINNNINTSTSSLSSNTSLNNSSLLPYTIILKESKKKFNLNDLPHKILTSHSTLILYEDNNIVVVSKPTGLLSQPNQETFLKNEKNIINFNEKKRKEFLHEDIYSLLSYHYLFNKYSSSSSLSTSSSITSSTSSNITTNTSSSTNSFELFLGLCHRLDFLASGCLTFSKNSSTASKLFSSFNNETDFDEYFNQLNNNNIKNIKYLPLDKHYLCLVEGYIDINNQKELIKNSKNININSIINNNIKKLSGNIISNLDINNKVYEVKLNFEVIRTIICPTSTSSTPHIFSLLKVKITKGKKHQIRRQLASKSYPIIGDTLYGSNYSLELMNNIIKNSKEKIIIDYEPEEQDISLLSSLDSYLIKSNSSSSSSSELSTLFSHNNCLINTLIKKDSSSSSSDFIDEFNPSLRNFYNSKQSKLFFKSNLSKNDKEKYLNLIEKKFFPFEYFKSNIPPSVYGKKDMKKNKENSNNINNLILEGIGLHCVSLLLPIYPNKKNSKKDTINEEDNHENDKDINEVENLEIEDNQSNSLHKFQYIFMPPPRYWGKNFFN